ncbi:MAG: glycoside hydrolase family 3 N-terminal domain-containing protein, partial [Bacteroidota bacterium]
MISSTLSAQYHPNLDQSTANEAIWVDSVYNAMSSDQRLGQLFMIRAHSNLGADHVAGVERLIRDHHVGGLCFFQGTPAKQVKLLNRYQSLANLPLMIAMDAEWGLNMRMKADVLGFPRQLMLGAIRKNHLIYEMGEEIARQMHRVGVHVNFAPVVDVNNNPDNPVIGTRSFGEDRVNVSLKGIHYMKGMQDQGIVACAKHFPGHGDTNVDSHYDLPLIPHSRARLDSIELYPFRVMIDQGIGSIMVGHLQVPALEDRPNYPTSLSDKSINELLREKLDFHGLTFTDGLGMKGVTKHFGDGQVEAEALVAGNDILLLPVDVAKAKARIEAYQQQGTLDEQTIRRKVKRVLRAKYRMGLKQFVPISDANIKADLNNPGAIALREELVENALTLVRDEADLVPIMNLKEVQITSLAIGAKSQPKFQQRLLDYAPVDLLRTTATISASEQESLLQKLADKDLVIVSLHEMSSGSKSNFGIKPSTVHFLEQLQQQNKVLLVVFGNPYSLRNFDGIGTVVEAYNEDELTQDKAAQAIFGVFGLNGRLPVSASERSPFNAGISTGSVFRMGYSTPERVGMNSDTLRQYIDEVAKEAISSGATPGCVVLIARHGKIVFQKSYGHHTYNRRRAVQPDDIYDLASITKVAATTMAIMDLVQNGQLNLDFNVGHYLTELRG